VPIVHIEGDKNTPSQYLLFSSAH